TLSPTTRWSPGLSGSPVVLPACSTSAVPSIAATVPMPAGSWARAMPAMAVRIAHVSRARPTLAARANHTSVYHLDAREHERAAVLEERNIRVVDRPVVRDGQAHVVRQHARDLGEEEVLVIDAVGGEIGEAVGLGIVVVSEHVAQRDARLPPGREVGADVPLVRALSIVVSGRASRLLVLELEAHREEALRIEKDELVHASRIVRAVADVLERRVQIGPILEAEQTLGLAPGLQQGEVWGDDGLLQEGGAPDRVMRIESLQVRPQ